MESKVIPTPEDFLDEWAQTAEFANWYEMVGYLSANEYKTSLIKYTNQAMHEYAVLFARHHVEQALKEASENVRQIYAPITGNARIDKDSILNAYKEDRIK